MVYRPSKGRLIQIRRNFAVLHSNRYVYFSVVVESRDRKKYLYVSTLTDSAFTVLQKLLPASTTTFFTIIDALNVFNIELLP